MVRMGDLLDFNPLRICSLCLHAGYEYQFAFGFFYNRRRIDETAALKQIAALVGCSRFHRFFCSIRFICDIIMANINKKQNNDRKPGSTPKPVTNRRVINEGVVKNRNCAGYVPKYPTSSDDNSKSNKNTR